MLWGPTASPCPPLKNVNSQGSHISGVRYLVSRPVLEGRKTDLVIFDKDGTLIDFDAAWTPWVKELNKRYMYVKLDMAE